MERVMNSLLFSFLVWRCHFLVEVGIYVKKLRQFLANEPYLEFFCTASVFPSKFNWDVFKVAKDQTSPG